MRSTSHSKHVGANEGGLAVPTSTETRSDISRHEAVVVGAGARRLVEVVQSFGVMRKSVLKREAGARQWHDYEFEKALHAAVKAGTIRRLPFGFYAKTSATDRSRHEHDPGLGR